MDRCGKRQVPLREIGEERGQRGEEEVITVME